MRIVTGTAGKSAEPFFQKWGTKSYQNWLLKLYDFLALSWELAPFCSTIVPEVMTCTIFMSLNQVDYIRCQVKFIRLIWYDQVK